MTHEVILFLSITILLVPLVSFLINIFFGDRLGKTSGVVGTTILGIDFLLAAMVSFSNLVSYADLHIVQNKFEWINLGTYKISVGFGIDNIAAIMLLVVTLISFLVHLFSTIYMDGDRRFPKFYAYLGLFTFSMLGIVMANNFLMMYIFWELVGISSYLLIGFWYEKNSASNAGKKAFITNRIGDLGFFIGIMILFMTYGSFMFEDIFAGIASGKLPFNNPTMLTLAGIGIFMGAMGKSAQFPLHVWLPDAMEGPTPVSALIHAATMVVAGVYLVARLFPVYALGAPDALNVVAWVGGISSLFAAVIACTQTDIKRVLAYSTMSQIGYMMLALGVSGYGGHDGLGFMAGNFHLFTHAMFKALLFLGAGAVIHAVHSNDMKDMGGLRKYLPITHITFLIACITIAGIPPLSGFFSKDEIMVAAWHHNKILFSIEFLVAGLTAFYMFRLYYSIFWGKATHYHHTPHEAPFVMTIPLMVLAFGSIFAGFLPFHALVTSDGMPFEAHIDWSIAIPSVLVGLVGIAIATMMYFKVSLLPDKMANNFGSFYKWAYHKFYMDEVYLFVTKKIIFRYISEPVAWFDRHVVDATMVGIATTTEKTSHLIKGMQSGRIQQYGYVFVTGAIALVLIFVYLW